MRVAGVACALVAGLSASAHADDATSTYGLDLGAAAMRESHAGTTTRFYAGFAFGASAGVKVSPTIDVSLRLLAVRGGDAEVEGDFDHVTATFLGPASSFGPLADLSLDSDSARVPSMIRGALATPPTYEWATRFGARITTK